jgi:hypothetical protein
VTKTTHLGTKWRSEVNGIHVDLYVPHQSTLGTRLQLPVSALTPHAVSLCQRRGDRTTHGQVIGPPAAMR